jgi:hypothetical protein
MRASSIALLSAGLVLAACEGMPDLAPHPRAVEPAGGDGLAPQPVVIRGQGFLGSVIQSGTGGAPSLEATHRAWLGGVELLDVAWVDARTLTATVPAGLAMGPHALTVENALGRQGTLDGAYTVIVPAALSAAASVAPLVASTGQKVTLTVDLVNTGGTALDAVALAVVPSGAGLLTEVAAPAPVRLEPGAGATLETEYLAAGPGDVALAVTASGREAITGRRVSAEAAAGPVRVEARAALAGSLAIPATLPVGAAFTATLTVVNLGQAAALGVVPGALQVAAGSVRVDAGPSPAGLDLPGGATSTFTWGCTVTGPGDVRLAVEAAGVDAGDGGAVTTGPVQSNLASQSLSEVEPVAADPFGDGLPGGLLAPFSGRVVWGTSRAGDRLLTVPPRGSPSVVGMTIEVDTGPSRAKNGGWQLAPPATTIGAPGCLANTQACGPDDEVGASVLAGGSAWGADRLVLGGVHPDNGGHFLYVADTDADPLRFAFVDTNTNLTCQGPSAVAHASGAAGDRLYAGWVVNAWQKSPWLTAVTRQPVLPGLDLVTAPGLIDLRADLMPGLGGGGPPLFPPRVPQLDVVAFHDDTLWLGSAGGLVRSTVPSPRPYDAHPEDWAVATPSDARWAARSPVLPVAGQPGASRAISGIVPFGDCGGVACLFAARTVLSALSTPVPQLWRCDPTGSGDPAGCDPEDWTLVAPRPLALDPNLTWLGDLADGALSLLVATPRYLYVGVDNGVTGARLFRAEVAPTGLLDLRGRDGCAAGTPGCQGLGGNGLGDPTSTRLLGAAFVADTTGAALFVLAGDGATPARLVRLPE